MIDNPDFLALIRKNKKEISELRERIREIKGTQQQLVEYVLQHAKNNGYSNQSSKSESD